MTWATFLIVKVFVAEPVAYVASPGVVAVIVQLPAATAVTTPVE
jgi:hypothetical protein